METGSPSYACPGDDLGLAPSDMVCAAHLGAHSSACGWQVQTSVALESEPEVSSRSIGIMGQSIISTMSAEARHDMEPSSAGGSIAAPSSPRLYVTGGSGRDASRSARVAQHSDRQDAWLEMEVSMPTDVVHSAVAAGSVTELGDSLVGLCTSCCSAAIPLHNVGPHDISEIIACIMNTPLQALVDAQPDSYHD